MKNVFIINQHSRAMFYGIGTYTQCLISALQLLPIQITVVSISTDYSELEIIEDEKTRSIHIPLPAYERYTRFFSDKEDDRFLRNIYYILLPYIPNDQELIFHFNFPELGKLASLLKENFSCKIVATMHYSHWSFNLLGDRKKLHSIIESGSNDFIEDNTRKLFFTEKKFYKEITDYVIAIAKHNYNDLLNIYEVPSSKVVLIPNGLKDEYKEISIQHKQEIRKKFRLNNNDRLLLFVGRITSIKGINILIQAFKEILKIRNDVHLMIIGDGSETELKEIHSQIYPFYSKISLTGFISKERLANIYSIADIGIIPSIHEEFGYVAIEMLMHGIPIIVNETTGLKEIVQNDINGLTFHFQTNNKSQSAIELCKKIMKLLDHPDKMRKYAQIGRKDFVEKYELNIFYQHIKNFYSHIN